jgi:hypothetical protein
LIKFLLVFNYACLLSFIQIKNLELRQ